VKVAHSLLRAVSRFVSTAHSGLGVALDVAMTGGAARWSACAT
jgi:hypothetical protein